MITIATINDKFEHRFVTYEFVPDPDGAGHVFMAALLTPDYVNAEWYRFNGTVGEAIDRIRALAHSYAREVVESRPSGFSPDLVELTVMDV